MASEGPVQSCLDSKFHVLKFCHDPRLTLSPSFPFPFPRIFPLTAPQLSAAAKTKQSAVATYCKIATEFLSKMNSERAFIASSITLGAALPLAILFSPSFLHIPFDLAVSIALPVHMYMGTHGIISDYAPKQFRVQALQGWGLLAAIAGFGLLKIGICGPGIGASIKSLWAPAKVQKKMVKQARRVD